MSQPTTLHPTPKDKYYDYNNDNNNNNNNNNVDTILVASKFLVWHNLSLYDDGDGDDNKLTIIIIVTI
jgi:hypothetical protein